jgi:RNA polymerase sigma-70 factor (ECF subfamily)
MVVVVTDVEGFSYKEMAAILDAPIGTVTSRPYRGRQQLQRTVWEHARDAGILASVEESRTA